MLTLYNSQCCNALAGFPGKRGEAFSLQGATHTFYFQKQIASLIILTAISAANNARVSYNTITNYITILIDHLCLKTGEI